VLQRAVGARTEVGALDVPGVAGTKLLVPELSIPVLRDAHRVLVRDRALVATLDRAIADERPDVIHAQQGSNFAPVLTVARRAGIPALATVRDYAPICLRTTRFTGGAICPGCSATRLGHCFADRYRRPAWLLAPIVPLGLAATRRRTRALDGFAQVVAVSGYVRDRLRESGVTAPIEVVSNLPPALVSVPSRPERAQGFEYVVFAGKLNPEKGADLLPAVARALPPGARLVVLGDGPLAPTLDDECARGAPILRLGDVSNDEVLRWIAHAQCLVLPSRWPEPLSRLLLEAGALGTPVVALATGGTPERIEDGKTGLLAATGDELVSAVRGLTSDASLRAALVHGSRALEAELGHRDAILARLVSIYEQAGK
jgi:glycosyltransferase involved in cell wall biosynthesis